MPSELQRLMDDVSAAKRKGAVGVTADAAAADVRAHRAPGELPKRGAPNLPDLILIDGRLRLRELVLTERHGDEVSERQLAGEQEWRDCLWERFGVAL